MNYRIVAIPESVADSVRANRKSPFARHPTHTEIATGHGPCRLCLRTFRVGLERRILFTYDPFADIESLPLPGPVFIHEAPCLRYGEDGGFPDELRSHGLTLNAYQRPRILRAQEYVTNGEVEPVIARLWERPDIDYIHVRDTEAGCYDSESSVPRRAGRFRATEVELVRAERRTGHLASSKNSFECVSWRERGTRLSATPATRC